MIQNIQKVALLSAYYLAAASSVLAQQTGDNPVGGGGTGPTGLRNPLKVDSIAEVILLLLDALYKIGVVIVAFMIIYVGFKFVMAQGKPEDIQKAKDALLYTIIGAAIVLGAKVIVEVLQATVSNIEAGVR